MKGMCDMCGRESDKIQAMLYNNDEDKMLCPQCWDYEAMRGDMEYERMREEQGGQDEQPDIQDK